jgi:hypothetical protein
MLNSYQSGLNDENLFILAVYMELFLNECTQIDLVSFEQNKKKLTHSTT